MNEQPMTEGYPARSARPVRLGLPAVLKVSRPGLIVSHLWVYLLATIAGGFRPSWNTWVGLAYVTVPLGLLIYGWNDYFDRDVDRISPRKNKPVTGAVFGLRLSEAQLAAVPKVIVAAQLPFAVLWLATGDVRLLGWLLLMAAGNALYNGPFTRFSRIPVVAELTATGIYLLIAWLGVLIHSPRGMPAWLWLFAGLSILNFQVAGTLVDRAEDAAVGKRTLSVAFGRTTAVGTILLFLAVKVALSWIYAGSLPATAVQLAGFALVATGTAFPGWTLGSTAYSSFIVLDWIWLALVWVG